MRINISGYKNIENLDYIFENNKLNVLIGISGSGKSAIAEALTNQDIVFNKKINYSGKVVTSIDGREPNDIKVFNELTVVNYLISPQKNTNIYSVLIDDEGALIDARKALDERLKIIQTLIKTCESDYLALKQIQSQLGASLTSKNKIKTTSAISKMRTSLQSLGKKRLYKKIASMDDNRVEWIIQGVPLIIKSKCPFCEKILNSKKDKELHEYVHLDIENKRKINLNSKQLTMLNTSGINLTLKGIDKLEKEIIDVGIALIEYDKLINDISYLYDNDADISKIHLNYEPQLVSIFPFLKVELLSLKRNLVRLQNNVIKAKENTKRILSNKLNQINDTIEKFGIPFKMEAIYRQSKIISYKLYHIDDASKTDREKGLSNGERKIIALIFFILENSKKDSELIVFDDPVSSYDDNRRLSIFTYIIEQLKNKTTLILSHDQVFAKFAIKRSKKIIGNVDYFDNYSTIKIIPITDMDFHDIEQSITDRIKLSKNYIQKIINLRFYYEIFTKRGIEYSYLSRILHKDDIANWLFEKGYNEADIVQKLQKKFSISLETFSSSYYSNIETLNFSLLEKMFLLREEKIVKKLKDELSNHIHLNSKYVISLNPYTFSFCSKYVQDAIHYNIRESYSM